MTDQRDDPDDRKDVNGEAGTMGKHLTQDPEQEQNTGYPKKHESNSSDALLQRAYAHVEGCCHTEVVSRSDILHIC